uniref:hypothetical protein n=1 Tax=Advenella sp. FME57 TaxID=2742604 RepID=UPI001D022C0B
SSYPPYQAGPGFGRALLPSALTISTAQIFCIYRGRVQTGFDSNDRFVISDSSIHIDDLREALPHCLVDFNCIALFLLYVMQVGMFT